MQFNNPAILKCLLKPKVLLDSTYLIETALHTAFEEGLSTTCFAFCNYCVTVVTNKVHDVQDLGTGVANGKHSH